jgi:hypothetical protein
MTLSVRPHLVWELRIRKYEGGEARKIEVGYQRSSNIIEGMDGQVGLRPYL